jgi:hypothetical protein
VQLQGVKQSSALTGSDGRFEFEDVPEGVTNIFAQKPGFFNSESLSGSEWTAPPVFKVGPSKNDFQVILTPAARIVGHITDKAGEPINGATIQILSDQLTQGRRQWQNRYGGGTDDDGSFRIDDLAPGRYILFTGGHSQPLGDWLGPYIVSRPAYYPDANDLASAQPIELRAGQEFRADLHLATEQGHKLNITVNGMPAGAGLGFQFQNSNGQDIHVGGLQFDQSRGQISSQAVPSGRWTLVVSANENLGHTYVARQEITVNHTDIPDLQISLHPAAHLPVTINRAVKAGQEADPTPQSMGLFARLISVDSVTSAQYVAATQSDPPILQFANVPAGKYRLDVPSNGLGCMESAWYGNVDLTHNYLEIGADGDATQPVVINLGDCATLKAQVRLNSKSASAFLVIVPNNAMGEPMIGHIGQQTSQSSVSISIAPGTYQVYAVSSLAGLEYANPEVMRDYPSQTVTLQAGQSSSVTLELTERKGN